MYLANRNGGLWCRVPMEVLAGGAGFVACSLAWLAFLLSERRPVSTPQKKAS